MKKFVWLGALLVLSSLLPAAPKEKPGSYEKKDTAYAVGDTVYVTASRAQAEQEALKNAIDKMAELLQKKGLGSKRDIALGVENSVTKETDLKAFKLGKARIESVYQERWEAPEGKEAWSVRVKISVRLR